MNGRAITETPFLTYWRSLARAWALLGLPEPSLREAMATWEAGRRDWREAKGLYVGGQANG